MESIGTSEGSLTVSETQGGGGDYDTYEDGATYEAQYDNLTVFMDESPWGKKKAARLYFTITRGKFQGKKASYKGFFFQDNATGAWIIGSKSKLAEAIRGVTGGKTIDASHKGKKVFITIKNKTTKAGKVFSLIDKIIPKPSDGDEEVSVPPQAQQQPQVASKTNGAANNSDSGLLDDLTELSDFS